NVEGDGRLRRNVLHRLDTVSLSGSGTKVITRDTRESLVSGQRSKGDLALLVSDLLAVDRGRSETLTNDFLTRRRGAVTTNRRRNIDDAVRLLSASDLLRRTEKRFERHVHARDLLLGRQVRLTQRIDLGLVHLRQKRLSLLL